MVLDGVSLSGVAPGLDLVNRSEVMLSSALSAMSRTGFSTSSTGSLI